MPWVTACNVAKLKQVTRPVTALFAVRGNSAHGFRTFVNADRIANPSGLPKGRHAWQTYLNKKSPWKCAKPSKKIIVNDGPDRQQLNCSTSQRSPIGIEHRQVKKLVGFGYDITYHFHG